MASPLSAGTGLGRMLWSHLVSVDHDVVGERPQVVGKDDHMDAGRVPLREVVPHDGVGCVLDHDSDHIVGDGVVPDRHPIVVADVDTRVEARPDRRAAAHDVVEVDQPVA
jgi:hypothetical protein